MGQSIKVWVGGTVFVAFLIVIAGWFLLISPTQAATAETRASIDYESNRTVTLTEALATLKTQYNNLDKTLAALKDISVQVPTKADSAAFRRVIVDRAATSGVAITTLSSGAAVAVTQPAAAAPSDTTAAGGATPSPSPSPAATDPAQATTGVATAPGQTLVGIPLEITVVGSYDHAKAFIASFQGTDGRLFVVSAFNLVTQPDAPASGGRPETVKGDVELFIQGYLVVLTASTAETPVTDVSPAPSPAPSPSPLPSTERNPFAPIASPTP